jgi:hypothetical protein
MVVGRCAVEEFVRCCNGGIAGGAHDPGMSCMRAADSQGAQNQNTLGRCASARKERAMRHAVFQWLATSQ